MLNENIYYGYDVKNFLITDLEKRVRELLRQGKRKEEVFDLLATENNRYKLQFLLNNLPAPEPRRKYLYLNIMLISMLGIITARKFMLATEGIDQFNVFMILSFVVPTINIYLMREIILFHRTGFQLTAILSAISLLNAENRVLPELVFIPLIIVISGFLYYRMYPADHMINT